MKRCEIKEKRIEEEREGGKGRKKERNSPTKVRVCGEGGKGIWRNMEKEKRREEKKDREMRWG